MWLGDLTEVVEDVQAVEAAHRAYYEAWERDDLDALCAMWVDAPDVTLILPGGEPSHGPEAVRDQLRELLDLTPGIQFLFEDISVGMRGDLARLTCIESPMTPDSFTLGDISEQLELSRLSIATLFLRTEQGWRVWHHQAAPVVTHLDLGG